MEFADDRQKLCFIVETIELKLFKPINADFF